MRAIDWATTPLGPVHAWPQSLKTCLRIILTSRQPMFVWWGEELINLYNDAYKSIVGGKHPEVLGQPARVVWREIWGEVGPRAETTMRTNEGTYDEALLLIMERNGYPEETYYTFSYSPVPNDQGGTGGIICANTDDTAKIIGERQLSLLRELATRTADVRSIDDVFARAAGALETNPRDLPFALLYLADGAMRTATLRASVRVSPGDATAPAELALDDTSAWPLARAAATQEAVLVDDLAARFGAVPTGAWDRAPSRAAILPLVSPGQTSRVGFLVVGLNPFRLFDDAYRGFLGLIAGQVAASIARAHAYEEEKQRAEALAELDRAKTAFFSNVSHEFRTPLTLMLGPVEDALAEPEDALTPTLRERLALVRRNGHRLQKLVNALLDFARIEAGRAQASYQETDLPKLTAELASAFESAIERGGLRYVVDCAALPAPVFVDPDLWEKIVLNLLSNAFKFTFEGAIRVTVRARDDRAELEVADTGVGIPEAELPHLFERFHRVQGARSRTHEGSGIGLALVHELVKLHGGEVRVASTPGQGTTFTVSLPFGSAHLPADRLGAPRALASTATGAAPYVDEALRWLPGDDTPTEVMPTLPPIFAAERDARILLADDNADMRDYLSRILSQRWRVETVANGEAALEAARARPPDVVITDIMMPRLDGFGLLAALRADERTRDVPVVMLSARSGEESRVEGLEAGAADYLVKPFSARELVARIQAQLAVVHMRRLEDRHRSSLEEANAEAVRANRAKDEFLAMLGHELRNPLAPIMTALQLMRLRVNAGAEKERAVIERQVNHLVRLVDDLLDVSRITRGKVELKKEPVELAEIVAKAIETASPLLEQREHRLDVTVPPRGLLVEADPSRMAQVVANLLTNAAKYTEPGGAVTVVGRRDGDEVVLAVRDTGIGIAREMLPRIFDLFTQEPQALDRAQGGLGLGLAIARTLVGMHGGTIGAESEGRGRGSVFTLHLPRVLRAGAVEGPGATSDAEPAPPGRRRVLVVDDNVDGADLLAMSLERLGCATCVAYDAPTALHLAETFDADLALLDIGLPTMDGFELARRLRALPRYAKTRFVALTGYGQESDRRRSAEAGFDVHLVKPVQQASIVELLRDDPPDARNQD